MQHARAVPGLLRLRGGVAVAARSLASSVGGNGDWANPVPITLFPGDGIGPEITDSVLKVFEARKLPIKWESFQIGTEAASKNPDGSLISEEALNSVRKNKLALKGPLATPVGKGHRSLNLTLRKELQLYANVRPAKTITGLNLGGVPSRTEIDVVVIRENTEGEYSGLEHEVVPGVVESLKVITRKASENIGRYAFEFAKNNKRNKVTAVHKANIMKMSDGLFLKCIREIASQYPDIEYNEVIVDACCMQLVRYPESFDVMVLPNLYGDIVSDLCAGLIGGLGLTPSANHGMHASLFEAVHGSAPDIAGQNKANSTALLLSSVMMLKHMGWHSDGDAIQDAIFKVFREGKWLTGDLGGKATLSEFTEAVIDELDD